MMLMFQISFFEMELLLNDFVFSLILLEGVIRLLIDGWSITGTKLQIDLFTLILLFYLSLITFIELAFYNNFSTQGVKFLILSFKYYSSSTTSINS
mgnify:CR=1 FL=1